MEGREVIEKVFTGGIDGSEPAELMAAVGGAGVERGNK